jgi:hypothetical protein
MKPIEYVESGEHLPDFMKDFHDQKDLFKAFYEQWNDGSVQVLKDVSWRDAHVFTVDIFLWWMGLHGYKLQKTRKKGVAFPEPEQTIKELREEAREKFSKLLKARMGEQDGL